MVTALEKNSQILVVEDDQDTSEYVCTVLEKAGYQAIAVSTGEDALDQIAEQSPDLVVLDLGLPGLSGLDVLRSIRARSSLPMIILSALDKGADRVNALESGADDYVSKPFFAEELVARVRALFRRVDWTPPNDTVLRVRELEIDMTRRLVSLRGNRLHLTPVEYSILLTLMRNAGQIVNHDDLLQAVWGENYHNEYSVLRVNISRLRHKLEENPRRPAYVVTVPSRGYWMPRTRP